MLTHDEAVEQARAGSLLIGVDAAWARRFFQETDPMAVRKLVGEPLGVQRAIVWFWWTCNVVFLIASVILGFMGFGAWALLGTPVALLLWWMNGGSASVGSQTFRRAFWPLALATVVASGFQKESLATGIASGWFRNDSLRMLAVLSLGASLTSGRFMYFVASRFIYALVLRNCQFYTSFQGKGFILKTVLTKF